MRITYISNLKTNEYSGGWSGMNHNIARQLEKRFHVRYIEAINPPYIFWEKLQSRLARTIGLPGVFPAFTTKRLDLINDIVTGSLPDTTDLIFFHGSTSWIHVKAHLPYALYLDACFATYIETYHNKNEFSSRQLKSIYEKEGIFLNNAKAVFFSSFWALNETRRHYDLHGSNFHVAGLGGAFEKKIGSLNNDPYFLFVGLDFAGKGGYFVVDAFKKVRQEYPHFKLKVAGAQPPSDVLRVHGVEYVGLLDKSHPGGLAMITDLFNNAYCLVLPTKKDMTPLVLVEAASVGCPAITTNNFGIPEMVLHEQTGLLIENSSDLPDQLANAMVRLCKYPSFRNCLGENAISYVQHNFSWERTGDIIAKNLQ